MDTIVTSADKAREVELYAANCNGTSYYHKQGPLSDMRYTDGVQNLAEVCGAYWLVDLIASHQSTIRGERPDHHDFQVWRFMLTEPENAESRAWVAECWTDTPGELGSLLLARQLIPYSNFPPELSPYCGVWVEGKVILLNREH